MPLPHPRARRFPTITLGRPILPSTFPPATLNNNPPVATRSEPTPSHPATADASDAFASTGLCMSVPASSEVSLGSVRGGRKRSRQNKFTEFDDLNVCHTQLEMARGACKCEGTDATGKCVDLLGVENIQRCLQWYWNKSATDAQTWLVHTLQTVKHTVQEGGAYTKYITEEKIPVGDCFRGERFCKQVFLRMFSITGSTYISAVQKALGQVSLSTKQYGLSGMNGRTVSHTSEQAAAWFRQWAKEVGEMQPNAKDELHCDFIEMAYLYHNEYKLDCEANQEAPCPPSTFYRVVEEESGRSPKIKLVKKKGTTSVCDTCIAIDKQLVNAGNCRAARAAARALRKAHRKEFSECRGIMWANRERGRRWEICHIAIDAMAKDKTTVPWQAKKGNAFLSWKSNALEIKLVAVIVHGYKTFLFPIHEWIPGNDHQSGGMIATMIHYVIQEMCKAKPWEKVQKPMPHDLIFQWDGGSENRNREIFSYIEFLCEFFTNVYINRLQPGHTHNDCDQLFGVIWGHLVGNQGRMDYVTIATYKEFIEEIQKALRKNSQSTEKSADNIIFVHLGTTFNIYAWKQDTYNLQFEHGIAPTQDYVGHAMQWDGNIPVIHAGMPLPVKEPARTSKMLHIHFFTRNGITWLRWAPRMDTRNVPYYPDNADTHRVIGHNSDGLELYGIRVTTRAPHMTEPSLNELQEWNLEAKKAAICNAHIRFPEFIKREHSQQNEVWFDNIPTMTSNIDGRNWIKPTWDLSDIIAARNSAQPLTSQPAPANRSVLAHDPVAHEALGSTINDFRQRHRNMDRLVANAPPSTTEGNPAQCNDDIRVHQLIFIRWKDHLEDQVMAIWPWTPYVLAKVLTIPTNRSRVQTFHVLLYNCLAYTLKHSPVTFEGSHIKIDVSRSDIVLSMCKTSSNTSQEINLTSGNLRSHVCSCLKLIADARFTDFDTYENATFHHLKASEPFKDIESINEVIGGKFKKWFDVEGHEEGGRYFTGTVISFEKRGPRSEGVRVRYDDNDEETFNVSQFIDTVVTGK